MAQLLDLERALAASQFAQLQHAMANKLQPYKPYQLRPNLRMPPPVDGEGQAIGVPICEMTGFLMPGVLSALARKQRMGQLGLPGAKAVAAKHMPLWKDAPPSGHRENSASTQSAFMIGKRLSCAPLLL